MRKSAIAFLLVAVAGAAALLIVAATQSRTLAFTLGTPSFGVIAQVRPGGEVCQLPIPVGAAFDEVEFQLGTNRRSGPPLAVTIRSEPGGAVIGRGELPAGTADNTRPRVAVDRVPDGGSIAVCLRNEGRGAAAIYGGPDVAARTSSAELDGRAIGADVDLIFRTAEPRSALALLPEMLTNASRFRGGWIGPWLYWVLLAGMLVAVPALLMRALAKTEDAGGRERDRDA